MASELLEIEPQELKFIVESKKQSSCSVQLTNRTELYVAFKVKTTSPKRYCVRPNAGVIPPKLSVDFTVTLQAARVAPSDMQCKDKFLIQSTVAPSGMMEDEIKPELFSRESGRYIEDRKLRVVFISPPHSPVLQPLDGSLKQEQISQTHVSKEVTDIKEVSPFKESVSHEDIPANISTREVPVGISLEEDPIPTQSEILKGMGNYGSLEPNKTEGIQHLNPIDAIEESKFLKDVEELKERLSILQARLIETEKMNASLKEEKSLFLLEKEKLKEELTLMKHKHVASIRVGFPFLFVCFIGLVGMVLGYMLG